LLHVVNCQILSNTTIGDGIIASRQFKVLELTSSESHLYVLVTDKSNIESPKYLYEYTLDLDFTRNLTIAANKVGDECSTIFDPTRNYLYITSGRNILTIDISSFSIIYEISTGFDDRTSVGFTTDYKSLYVASKQGIHWGFSQFSLPNLGYIGWHQVDGLQLCVPSNATFYYGETYWCDGVGEENSNIAICYGQVYKPKKQYKIYQIDLNTWTSSAYTTGYLMSTTKIKNPGVFFYEKYWKKFISRRS